MDTITIGNLHITTIIGCNPVERTTPQEILLTVHIGCDCAKAGASDDLKDTLNYDELAQKLSTLIQQRQFYLLEAAAEEVARLCLESPLAREVTVSLRKPQALKNADYAEISITRCK